MPSPCTQGEPRNEEKRPRGVFNREEIQVQCLYQGSRKEHLLPLREGERERRKALLCDAVGVLIPRAREGGMAPSFTAVGICIIIACLALPPSVSGSSLPYPSLDFVDKALLTTAADDFDGNANLFETAAKWNQERLRASHTTISTSTGQAIRAPHLACAGHDRGREIFSRLQGLLSPKAVRHMSLSSDHGACFLVTASHAQVDEILAEHDLFGLESLAPFPSPLKLAPGLLEHRQDSRSGRLGASHGSSMRMGNIEGLSVELSPGTLTAHSPEADSFIESMLEDLMSESLDLQDLNFWSNPVLFEDENLDTPGGAVRRRDWVMVATLVHELARSGNTSPADICSWTSVSVDHPADDVLLVQGMYHTYNIGLSSTRVATWLVPRIISRVSVKRGGW